MRHAFCESGHLLKFNGPFTQSNVSLFEKDDLPPLLPTIPESLGGTTQRPRIQEEEPIKLTRLERDLANDVALELPVREQYKIHLLDLAIRPTIFIFDKIQFVDSGSVCPFVAGLDTGSRILYAVRWSDEFVRQFLSPPTSIIRVY